MNIDPNKVTTHIEREKYIRIHSAMDYSSQTVPGFIEYCQRVIPAGARILEIGSGTGSFIRAMRAAGYDAWGSDITLRGVDEDMEIYCQEVAAWRLPYDDDAFDWIVSCDVLEHLPTHLVPVACREFGRVARWGQVHNIATFEGQRFLGYDCHLTVRPIGWWWEQFNHQINDVHVIGRDIDTPVTNLVRYEPGI